MRGSRSFQPLNNITLTGLARDLTLPHVIEGCVTRCLQIHAAFHQEEIYLHKNKIIIILNLCSVVVEVSGFVLAKAHPVQILAQQ